MDPATLVGMVAALVLIAGAAATATSLSSYIDLPAFAIVFGGTFCVVLARSTLKDFTGSIRSFIRAVRSDMHDPEETIERLAELAALARKEGVIALEFEKVGDPFFERGLQLLVDGADEHKLTAALRRDIHAMELRHDAQIGVWQAWIDVAPAMGLIGTLIGLVGMLGNMTDPKRIGPAMAVAILTTLYGAIIANVIGLPVVSRLKTYSAAETEHRHVVLDGLCAIARGEHPRKVRENLTAVLPPFVQKRMALVADNRA
jgi:chemotaxis protein MotA